METLREFRRQRGWSQKDLADESGVGQDTISGIEKGRHEPRPSTLRKLADALEVEVADFFREPALPKAEAPGAGQASAEQAGFLEGVAAAVDSFAARLQTRLEGTNHTDGNAMTELLEDSWLAHRGAQQLLEDAEVEAAQKRRETPAERRARAKLERAVMRLTDLSDEILAELVGDPRELEWTEEPTGVVISFFEEMRSRRAG